jgi:hypothetical protein
LGADPTTCKERGERKLETAFADLAAALNATAVRWIGISGIAVIGRWGALNDDRYRRDDQRRSCSRAQLLVVLVAAGSDDRIRRDQQDGRSGGEIAKSMRLMAKTHDLDKAGAAPVEKADAYLAKHTRLLHYDRALADGLPIATGVIEGACRYLVQDRMGRTGARWSLTGAEAILRLRALRASGDFDAYWQFHLAKEHERTHQSLYAGGRIPDPAAA